MLLGKQFKLDIWEKLVKTMRVGEVAEFVCDKQVCVLRYQTFQFILDPWVYPNRVLGGAFHTQVTTQNVKLRL